MSSLEIERSLSAVIPPAKKKGGKKDSTSPTDDMPGPNNKEVKPAEKPADCKAGKKINPYWSAIFQTGVFLVVSFFLVMIRWDKAIEWSSNFSFLLSPLYVIFAACCLLSWVCSLATGNSTLRFVNIVMWAVMAIVLVMMLGQVSLEKKARAQTFSPSRMAAISTYQPPLGFVPGEYFTNLDLGQRWTFHFPPGRTTNVSFDTDKSRCGNDSLLIIGGNDTLRTWLPDQSWRSHHKLVTAVALAKMDSVKATIWQN
ncbi:MAG TPA: hypothetical protein VMC41_03790 [Candidatus Nanoarchaeia archaeon]|nr:hypothetical protein [Candidatus Nanoarchaeia archaeon]